VIPVRTWLAGAALSAIALGFAACGDEPKTESDRVKQAAKDYASGIADGDVDEACEHVAGDLTETCQKDAARLATNLEDAKIFKDNTEELLEGKQARIRGNLACVPASSQSFDFQKVGDEWRLIALGRSLEDPKDCLVGLEPPT
jgi:hypothetical protein